MGSFQYASCASDQVAMDNAAIAVATKQARARFIQTPNEAIVLPDSQLSGQTSDAEIWGLADKWLLAWKQVIVLTTSFG